MTLKETIVEAMFGFPTVYEAIVRVSVVNTVVGRYRSTREDA